jgi:hypothetical protein
LRTIFVVNQKPTTRGDHGFRPVDAAKTGSLPFFANAVLICINRWKASNNQITPQIENVVPTGTKRFGYSSESSPVVTLLIGSAFARMFTTSMPMYAERLMIAAMRPSVVDFILAVYGADRPLSRAAGSGRPALPRRAVTKRPGGPGGNRPLDGHNQQQETGEMKRHDSICTANPGRRAPR